MRIANVTESRFLNPNKVHGGIAMASSNRRIYRKPEELHPHPLQAKAFPDLSDPGLEALAEDIKRNGLQHPVEICRDNTIICGHRRVQAARKLGLNKIEVIIREDVEDQGPKAIERYLIEDNFNRRQLSRLERARCIKLLDELYENELDPTKWQPRGELQKIIAKRLDLSGREVSRYLRVLETPIAVQNAFDEGKLSLVKAGQVTGLSKEQQDEIAVRITAGEEPRKLVDSFLRNVRRRQPDATDTYLAFVKLLNRLLDNKPQAVEDISPWVADESALNLFEEGIGIFQRLKRWTKSALERQNFTP
jgi:ParB/RepB/Spo0J family partition protein